ncbi:bacterio-opsin activator [Halobiforma lacisalsi AJ5]|uniref:Bacterio-opsin activator n=1 Tax=Natronobacterium lacisalsi AJ5 TaxID=358396 RepID=M0LG04_NATLA|nr:helix-turn-helix domain-containing protein [Halobiforma lacisalsi]APW98648.1 bacterio-opsin activator [Halobiforma lacisalsi AJ5]EMA32517.1 bacterio-opsin activator HTH domain-containing protein [Halobiforma lacisalsi AJ5]
MTTVVELEIPADRLGFARTFDRVSTFEFRIGGLIGDSAPLVRVAGPDRHTVDDALEADPSVEVIASVADRANVGGPDSDGSVAASDAEAGSAESNATFDVTASEANVGTAAASRTHRERGRAAPSNGESGPDRGQWLYRLDFRDGLKLFQQIVAENDGAILAAHGRDGRWSLQLLYHDRESVSASHDLFGQYDFRVEVTRISTPEDLERERTPLTETQYETIVAAHELGYFDVPRRITLEELAAELDVSHQALSERLRRSHAALISAELSARLSPAGIDP